MIYKASFLTGTLLFFVNFCYSQEEKQNIGAFYFDGWTQFQWDNYEIENYQLGAYNDLLISEFSDRKPLYGWVTSTQDGIKKQAEDAKRAGISFFIFDWYYCKDTDYDDCFLNNAIKLYMQQTDLSLVKFASMITNDTHDISVEEWKETKKKLLEQFQHPLYFKTDDNRPLILIYQGNKMLRSFKGVKKFDRALKELSDLAGSNGFGQPLIGIMNISPSKFKRLKYADFLSLYNDPFAARRLTPVDPKRKSYTQDELREGSLKFWKESIVDVGKRKFFVPTITAGWDNRPWINIKEDRDTTTFIWYEKAKPQDLKRSILEAYEFNNKYNSRNSANLIFVNSWNEYGEGSHISPMANGEFIGMGIKEALEKLKD